MTFTLTFQRASLLNDKPALPLWVKSWSATPGANIPCNAVSNRPYSGWNVVLLWMTQAAGYRTPRFLTVRQALELGGHVPADLVGDDISKKPRGRSVRRKPRKHPKRATDRAADREAALAFKKEQKRREHERAKEEAAQRKERERRQKAVEKAQRALDAARRKHEKFASDIQAQFEALEGRSQAEEARWDKEKARLEAALRRARGYG